MNLVINASKAFGEHPGEIPITAGIKETERSERFPTMETRSRRHGFA